MLELYNAGGLRMTTGGLPLRSTWIIQWWWFKNDNGRTALYALLGLFNAGGLRMTTGGLPFTLYLDYTMLLA